MPEVCFALLWSKHSARCQIAQWMPIKIAAFEIKNLRDLDGKIVQNNWFRLDESDEFECCCSPSDTLSSLLLDFPFAAEGTLDHLVIFTQNLDDRRNLSFPFRNSSSKKHFESIKTSKAIERDFTCLIVGTHFMCNVIKCHYFSTPEINSKLSLRDDTTLLQAH